MCAGCSRPAGLYFRCCHLSKLGNRERDKGKSTDWLHQVGTASRRQGTTDSCAHPRKPRHTLSPAAHSPVEDVFVSVHVQRVDVEVIGSQVERFKHLPQGQVLAVPTIVVRGSIRWCWCVGWWRGGKVGGSGQQLKIRLPVHPQTPSTHLKMTTSSGSFFSLLLMKRSRCFWCMHALRDGPGGAAVW